MEAQEIRKEARNILNNRWGKAALVTLVFLLFELIVASVVRLFSFIPLIGLIFSIGQIAISIPVSESIFISFLRIKRGEDVEVLDFLTYGFKNFAQLWKIAGNILLKTLVPFILLIVFTFMMMFGTTFAVFSAFTSSSSFAFAGAFAIFIGVVGCLTSLVILIVQLYHYVFAYNISYDHPEMAAKDCVAESRKLMDKKRFKLFCLQLTFIGWAALVSLIYVLLAFIFRRFLAIPTIGLYACLCFLQPYIFVAMNVFYDKLCGKETEVETVTEVAVEEKKEKVEAKKEITAPEPVVEPKEESKEEPVKEIIEEEKSEPEEKLPTQEEEITDNEEKDN